MTPELTALGFAALLQIAQLAAAILFGDAQNGIGYAVGPRDEPRLFTGLAGRLDRALNNHQAALGLFTIAVLVVTLGGESTPLTVTCAWIYVIARAAYVPAYAFGLTPWRSLIWGVGLVATAIMLLAALI